LKQMRTEYLLWREVVVGMWYFFAGSLVSFMSYCFRTA